MNLPLEMNIRVSFAGLYVPNQVIFVLLCSYAIPRGSYRTSKLYPVYGVALEQDQVLKSGFLNKKAQRTKRWIKHWFILRNDALSWYQSSSVRNNL
jgi:hypothetical protein